MSAINSYGDRRKARFTILSILLFLFAPLTHAQEISPNPDDYDVDKYNRLYEDSKVLKERADEDLRSGRDQYDEASRLYNEADGRYNDALTAKDSIDRNLEEFRRANRDLQESIDRAGRRRGPLSREIDELNIRIRTLVRNSRLPEKRQAYEETNRAAEQAEREAGPLRRELAVLERQALDLERQLATAEQAERNIPIYRENLRSARASRGTLPNEILRHNNEVARLTPIVNAQGIKFRQLDADAATLDRESAQLNELFKKARRRGDPNARNYAIAAAKKAEEAKAKRVEARGVERQFQLNATALKNNHDAAEAKQRRLNGIETEIRTAEANLRSAEAVISRLGPQGIRGLRMRTRGSRQAVVDKNAELESLFTNARNLRNQASTLLREWEVARAPVDRLRERRDPLQRELEELDTNVTKWQTAQRENDRLARPLEADLRRAEADLRIADAERSRYFDEKNRLSGRLDDLLLDQTRAQQDLDAASESLARVQRNLEQGLRDAPFIGETEGQDHGDRAGKLRGGPDGTEAGRKFAERDARHRGMHEGNRLGREEAERALHAVDLAKVELDNVRDFVRDRDVRRVSDLREELRRRRGERRRDDDDAPRRWRRDDRDRPRDDIDWSRDPLYRPILDLRYHPEALRKAYEDGYRKGFYAKADYEYAEAKQAAFDAEAGRDIYREMFERIRDDRAAEAKREVEEEYRTNPVLIVAGAEAHSTDAGGVLKPGDQFTLDLLVRNFGSLDAAQGEFSVEITRLPEGVTIDRGREEVPLVGISRLTEASVSNVHLLKIAEDVQAGATLYLEFNLKRLGETVQPVRMEIKLGESLSLSVIRKSDVDPRGGENSIEVSISNSKRVATGPLSVRLVSTDGEAEFVGESTVRLADGIEAGREQRLVFKYRPFYRDFRGPFEFMLTVSQGRERRVSKEIIVPAARR